MTLSIDSNGSQSQIKSFSYKRPIICHKTIFFEFGSLIAYIVIQTIIVSLETKRDVASRERALVGIGMHPKSVPIR